MGRHADPAPGRRRRAERPRLRISVPVVLICLLFIGAIALGAWWWNLRSVTDPIDANPVDAYAVVVSSPPCPGNGRTTVLVTGPQVTATLSGCGFTKDQRLAVQYLAGHPQQVRQAGTSTSGTAGLAGRLLPIGILAAGLVAVLATIALMVERQRSRHLAAGSGISVAELAARTAAARRSAGRGIGDGEAGDGAPADEATADGGAARRGRHGGAGHHAAGDAERDGRGTGEKGTGDEASGDAASGDEEAGDGGTDPSQPEPSMLDAGEPAHVLPSGFVIVDEQLFTHSGTEAPGDGDRPGG